MTHQESIEGLLLKIKALATQYATMRKTKLPALNNPSQDTKQHSPQISAEDKTALQTALQTLKAAHNYLTTNTQKP